MKTLLSIALCATAVSAFAASTETVLGQVGVTAITSSLSNTIVAVSYDDLAGGTGIVVSNFVKTTNLTVGDQLAIFNNGLYDTWTLKEKEGAGGVKVKYWDKNALTYTVGPDGKLVEGTGNSADLVSRSVGTGIWLVRQNPTDKDRKAIPFYIYGKPSTTTTSTTVAGNWTLVGNPLQTTSVTIGSSTVSGVQTGDQIVTAAEDGRLHYYTFTGSQWTHPITIGPGIGFWIKTKAETTITWTASKE